MPNDNSQENKQSNMEKILHTASLCFFQHGYRATNISMISRHVNISRVTIHKLFQSKEVLFRAVVANFFKHNNDTLASYIESEGDFWIDTEALIIQRCNELFNDVASNIIRTDLIHAGQEICHDLIYQNENLIKEVLCKRISKEVQKHTITLSKINMSAEALAESLFFSPFGITFSVTSQDNNSQDNDSQDKNHYIKNLMTIYNVATKV